MFPAILGPLIGGLLSIVDDAVEDKDLAARLKATIQTKALTGDLEGVKAAAAVIQAEANGESWLQRNWRPLLMVLFGVIIANNFIIVPIFNTPSADIPPDMWDLLKLGVGGYVVGRTVEKGIKQYKDFDHG